MNSGQVVNHISTDAQNIAMSVMFIQNAWASPLKILIAVILLANEVGVAALIALVVLVVLLPVNYFLAAKMGLYQKKSLQVSDDRLKNSNEMLQGMCFNWEIMKLLCSAS